MTRVKGGKTALKTRKNTLKMTKGYRFGRSTKERQANEAIVHAGSHAFRDRRDKKNNFRRLWTIKLNAALETQGMSYSKFIGALKKKNIELDRKVLAEIAEFNPKAFEKIVAEVK
jgi:large subunit ribosomal protein L20